MDLDNTRSEIIPSVNDVHVTGGQLFLEELAISLSLPYFILSIPFLVNSA